MFENNSKCLTCHKGANLPKIVNTLVYIDSKLDSGLNPEMRLLVIFITMLHANILAIKT